MSDKELMQEALKWQEHIKVLANGHADDELYQKRSKVFDWLIEQAKKVERYEKALREIANEQEVGEGDFNADDVANNLIATAKEALEESK